MLMIGAVKSVPKLPLLEIAIGSALDVGGHELALARLRHLARDRLGEAARRHLVGMRHHRHDQSLMREIDGDAEMDVAMQHEIGRARRRR